MGKWVLYTQPNYAHPKPTKTHPFETPSYHVVHLELMQLVSGLIQELIQRANTLSQSKVISPSPQSPDDH